jgi:mono/diheme cytochrome c family protein
MKFLTRLGAAGLLALPLALAVGAGCSEARRPNTLPAHTLRQNPRLAEGQRVFMQNCNQCHVGGAAGLGPSINDKRIPSFVLKFQVRHGLGQMPAFGPRRISDAQLDDLTWYVKYLHDHPGGPTRS